MEALNQTGKINIAMGVDFPLRVSFVSAGASVDPAEFAAPGATPLLTVLCDIVLANVAGGAGAVVIPMIAYALNYSTPNVGANNVWQLVDNAAAPIPGAYIISLAAATFNPSPPSILGWNGRIRIYSTIAEFDDIWVDFHAVRFGDSQFQNLSLGSELVNTGTNQLEIHPMEPILAGNHVDFDLTDRLGNPTSVQPVQREFNTVMVAGTAIPD